MTGPAPAAIRAPASVSAPSGGTGRRWSARRATAAAAGLALAALGLRELGGLLPGQVESGLATLLVLWLPGWALARAVGDRLHLPETATVGLAPLAGLALWGPAAAAGFGLGLPLWAALAIVLVAAATAMGAAPPTGRGEPGDLAAIGLLAAAGALLGVRWQAPLTGDALFHAGVVRKLVALPRLSLDAVWPFQHGHAHAGYAFPLLHAAQAGAIWVTGIDPSTGYRNLTPAFAAMLPVAAYPLGRRLAGRRGGWLAGLLALWVGASNGGLISYSQQPRFVVTAILLPGLLLLLVHRPPRGRWTVAAVVAAAVLCTILHVTYAAPVLAIIAAVAVAERAWPVLACSAAGCAAVAGWIWAVALRGPHEHQYLVAPGSFFLSLDGNHLALSGPQIFDNRPEFALAAAGAAWLAWRIDDDRRRRLAWAAGAVLMLAALPGPTPLLQALAGPGQATRTWEMIPAGLLLAVLLARPPTLSRRSLALVAAGSLAISASQLMHTPAASVISLAAALAVLAAAVSRRRWSAPVQRPLAARTVALTALAVMIGPICVTGWPVLRELAQGKHQTTVADVTPGLVRYLRRHERGLPVVLAPYTSGVADNFAGTAYALVGNATIYTVAESSAHTESELRDQPIVRRQLVTRFLAPATTAAARHRILRLFDVSYVVAPDSNATRGLLAELDADRWLRRTYTDPPAPPGDLRFTVYRVVR